MKACGSKWVGLKDLRTAISDLADGVDPIDNVVKIAESMSKLRRPKFRRILQSKVNRAVKSVVFVIFNNFGPLLIFYVANHFLGLKTAIVTSTVFAVAEITFKIVRKGKIGGLLIFSTLMTLIFGVVDLYSANPFMIKYEPSVSNVLTGIWVMYFVLKAGAYYVLSTKYDLEQAMAIRAIVGTGSFYFLTCGGAERIEVVLPPPVAAGATGFGSCPFRLL
jgi:intracellular septation protein A